MSDTPKEGRRVKRDGARAQRASQGRVFTYMAILFAAAFLLLLMAFLMQQRSNRETIDDLTESMTNSMTSIHSLQSLVEVNQTLEAENDTLKEEKAKLEAKISSLEGSLGIYKVQNESHMAAAETSKTALKAMDWFWQVDEAYVRGRYTLCRELMASMEEQDLVKYLPAESVTDNGRFSPADRYAEIYERLH